MKEVLIKKNLHKFEHKQQLRKTMKSCFVENFHPKTEKSDLDNERNAANNERNNDHNRDDNDCARRLTSIRFAIMRKRTSRIW